MYGKGNTAPNAKFNNPLYIGQQFGWLKVLEITHVTDGKYQRWMWKCKCECGTVGLYRGDYVWRGHTKSCGCALHENKTNLKHGESKTKLFTIWVNMRRRCDPENTKNAYHHRYGGRGIKVYEGWNDYEEFAKWARQNGYYDGLTIERKNNDGDYCPENCTWANRKQQARNRNTTLYVSYHGKDMSLAEACEIAGMPYKQVWNRITRLGWPAEDALSIPFNTTRKWKRSERFCKGSLKSEH